MIAVPMRDPNMGGGCSDLRRLRVIVAEPPTAGKGGAFQPRVEQQADVADLHEDALQLPRGDYDVPLLISDCELTADAQTGAPA